MIDDVNLFKINEDGTLIINKDEVREIKEFRQILFDDKGSEGDADGRKKYYAYKVFKFIRAYVHPTSIYRDLPEKKKFKNCVAFAELPDTWQPNDIVKAAMTKYKKLIPLSALFHAYLNANKGVYNIGEDLELLNERRDSIRIKVKALHKKLENTKDKDLEAELFSSIEQQTQFLLNVGNQIMKLSNDLPSSFNTVEELKKKLAKEESQGSQIYGGGNLGRREK